MSFRMFFVPMRTAIAALLFANVMSQPAQADIFYRPPTAADIAQLATAVLSLPASAAAIAYPDSKALACTEHTIKAINEILATMNPDNGYHLHPAAWLVYDVVQAIAVLRSTPTKPQENAATADDSDSDTNDDATFESTDNEEAKAPQITPQDWGKFKQTARHILACAEALIRILAASKNDNTPHVPHISAYEDIYCHGQYLWNKREFLHSLTSLTRLASICLNTEKRSYQTVLIILLIANIIDLIQRDDATETAYEEYLRADRAHEEQQKQTDNQQIPPVQPWSPYNYTTPATNTAASVSPATTTTDWYVPSPATWQPTVKKPTATRTHTTPVTASQDESPCPSCLAALNAPADDAKDASLADRTTVRELSCKHKFHTCCINRWINYPKTGDDVTCPICRAVLTGADLAPNNTNA